MAWASTRGNARNAHACALRTAPATQHREAGGRHLGLPHHQERHGPPAVTARWSGAAPAGPTLVDPHTTSPKRRPGPRGAAVPRWACPSGPVILGLARGRLHRPVPGGWLPPGSGSGDRGPDRWSWLSSARPTPFRPPDRHGAGAGGRAEASPTSTGFRGYRTAAAGSSGAGRAASSPARKDPLGRRATCRCQSTDRCRTAVITHASMFCLSGQVTDERRAGTWRCAQATR